MSLLLFFPKTKGDDDKMKLVLAEKPSVAQSIAKVICATKRHDGYLEGNGYVVSWCVGHLVELVNPEGYDEKYNKWNYDDLPILPERWKYEVSDSTRKQFAVLKKLMKRDDVESLVCATDAGREGELIFRLVYHQCGCRKPFERLWISSMEDSAIKKGFENLEPSTKYDSLYESALCRERADWIVGINATRLFSCLYHQTLNVGRVMTPTLAMVVMREASISAFKQESFYTVQLEFKDFIASSERFQKIEESKALQHDCQKIGKCFVAKVEKKEKKENAPALYDLTSLQRDSNRILGFTAQQTLDYTQSLYEKKLVTYPRTDSRYLTEDMKDLIPDLLRQVETFLNKKSSSNPNIMQVINGKKVSDHHAIIPTKEIEKCNLEELPKGECAVLELIANRLLVSVSEAYRYEETTLELNCNDTLFKAKGKTVLSLGWKSLAVSEKDSKEETQVIPLLAVGDELSVNAAGIKEGKTSPPKLFTEDTLLQAMENAAANEMPKEAERKGIGTPATRAGIIEKLVSKGYLKRKGNNKVKSLVPTDKGVGLITVMPEQIQSVSMTADWEEKLLKIEHKEYPSYAFMIEIETMVKELVKTYEVVKGADVIMPKNYTVIGHCPHCGNEVVEREKGWFCSNRQCRFVLWKDNAFFNHIGKKLTEYIVDKLLRDGRAKLKDCKSKKTGKSYNADVVIGTEADGKATFHLEFDTGGKK